MVIRVTKRTRSPQAGKHLSRGNLWGLVAALSLPLKEKEGGYFENRGYKGERGDLYSFSQLYNPHIYDHCQEKKKKSEKRIPASGTKPEQSSASPLWIPLLRIENMHNCSFPGLKELGSDLRSFAKALCASGRVYNLRENVQPLCIPCRHHLFYMLRYTVCVVVCSWILHT